MIHFLSKQDRLRTDSLFILGHWVTTCMTKFGNREEGKIAGRRNVLSKSRTWGNRRWGHRAAWGVFFFFALRNTPSRLSGLEKRNPTAVSISTGSYGQEKLSILKPCQIMSLTGPGANVPSCSRLIASFGSMPHASWSLFCSPTTGNTTHA